MQGGYCGSALCVCALSNSEPPEIKPDQENTKVVPSLLHSLAKSPALGGPFALVILPF